MPQIIEHVLKVEASPISGKARGFAHFSVSDGRKGREYMLMAGASGYFTVVCDRWINSRRAFGKTFWSVAELQNAYRQHGGLLAEYAGKLATMRAEFDAGNA